MSQPRSLLLGLFVGSTVTFDPIWTPAIETVSEFAHNGAESLALPQMKSEISCNAVSRNPVIASLERRCVLVL